MGIFFLLPHVNISSSSIFGRTRDGMQSDSHRPRTDKLSNLPGKKVHRERNKKRQQNWGKSGLDWPPEKLGAAERRKSEGHVEVHAVAWFSCAQQETGRLHFCYNRPLSLCEKKNLLIHMTNVFQSFVIIVSQTILKIAITYCRILDHVNYHTTIKFHLVIIETI